MRLRQRRWACKLTAKQITAGYPGMDKYRYSAIENGHFLPTAEFFRHMCKKLHCDPLDIYERKEIDLLRAGRGQKAPVKENRKLPYKMTFRLSGQVRTALNDEVFNLCGYNTRQSWFDDCVKQLLKRYELKKETEQLEGQIEFE